MFLAVTCSLLFLSTCVVSARFVQLLLQCLWSHSLTVFRFLCRIRYTKNLGFDDYSIAVALAVAITLGVMNGFHISYGAGLVSTILRATMARRANC
jgi:hypothetical protein